MAHVLIVDDDSNARAALAELVAAEGFTAALANDLREARIQLTRQRPDVVLIDLKLPDGSGTDLFESIDTPATTEIILMTGHASVETAVEAMRLGAADYLTKPLNLQRVKAVLSRVPKASELKAEIGSLRNELRNLGHFGQITGRSDAMQNMFDRIIRVAPTEATVLLIGESGTGKELAARTIHDLSRRRKQAFLPVNCGAISPNLIESEMFGHEKGSFTSADRQHKGYFERAHGGTLFLDEITEMPIELQVKLLRVLETGMFMRVGTNQQIEADLRIIAATNRDPEEAVTNGKLRADLYHRLNVFPIPLPALRERGKDIELLAQHFLKELNVNQGTQKFFPGEMLANLNSYHWPGNVRELKNYVQRAFILADRAIDAALPSPLTLAASNGATLTVPIGSSLEEADKQLILATLARCGGVKKKAAEILGISLKTLYNRLEEFESQTMQKESRSGAPSRSTGFSPSL